jgi:hypothetical protein
MTAAVPAATSGGMRTSTMRTATLGGIARRTFARMRTASSSLQLARTRARM